LGKAQIAKRHIDVLSPPVLFGGMYLFLYGLGAIDVVLFQDTGVLRLWRVFSAWQGISLYAIIYISLGFALFSVGYYLSIGCKIATPLKKITSAFTFVQARSFIVPAALFVVAYFIQIWVYQRFILSRIPGLGGILEQITPNLSFLIIVGDLVLMAYAFNIWRFMLSRRPEGPKMSHAAKLFLFGVMVPSLAFLLTIGATRSRIAYFIFVTLLAYHYGYRQVRARTVVIAGLVVFLVISPMIAILRASEAQKQTIVSLKALAIFSWDVIFTRTTSLEGFTVTFENLGSAPKPDPLWMLVGSIIPRVYWPDKPWGTLGERFSLWASGRTGAMLTPSLPGELLLHFGFVGGLLAMFFLGVLWRIAFVALIGSKQRPSAAGFIYILLLPFSLQAIEGGFVIEYGALLRFLVVGLIVFGLACRWRTRSARMTTLVDRGRVANIRM